MEMTMKITVPVEVSRETLGLWVAGMLNVPNIESNWVGFSEDQERGLALLDEMDGDVDVDWSTVEMDGKVFAAAVKLWGKDFQAMMLAEECGELVAAMSQYLRLRVAAEKVIEEAADVYVMLAQVPHLLGGDPVAHQKAISKVAADKKRRLEDLVYGEAKP